MKIANTKTALLICLTELEYKKLGSPKRAQLKRISKNDGTCSGIENNYPYQLIKCDSNTGGKVGAHKDKTHPYRMGFYRYHPVRAEWEKFGTELVKSFWNGSIMMFDKPEMKYDVMKKTHERPSKQLKLFTETPLDETPPQEAIKENNSVISRAVEFINKQKDSYGKQMVISTDSEGYLEVLMRSGR